MSSSTVRWARLGAPVTDRRSERLSSSTSPAAAVDNMDPQELVAVACRVLAHRGLAEDVLGHVSVRAGTGSLAVRCRGPRERGLLFTERADVHVVGLDEDAPLPGRYTTPNELPIHREILRARPDVQAVVHVHPPAVVAVDLAGLRLRPIVGAYNIPAMRLADEGVPVYPRAVLINDAALGQEVARVLGSGSACLLRGHGIVTTGSSVEQAVVRALNLDALARITLLACSTGAVPPDLPEADVVELPDLGGAFNDGQVWRNALARLEHAGLVMT
jgi:ribulose-5-phosphate 4-epimerase/fuculose-1-phosphate aldolase